VGTEIWPVVAIVSHTSALIATAVNVHFVSQFVASERFRRLVPVAYAVFAGYCVLLVSGHWWVPGTVHLVHSEHLGVSLDQVLALPALGGASAYLMSGLSNLVCIAWLTVSFRRGRRDVQGTLIGLCIVVACSASDVLTIVLQLGSPPLLPYGFLIYGF